MDMQNEQKGLDRYLSSIDVWAMAFGCMVGWGAFVMPGTTFLPTTGPLGTTIALAIGILIMVILAISLSYLMRQNPRTGGVYSYTKEAFGRDHAFLCSWFLCLSYLTIVFLNATALFVVIRTIMGDGSQLGFHYNVAGNSIYLREVAVSVLALAVVGLLFIVAKPILQRLLTILSVVLLIGVILISIFCLPHAMNGGVLHSFGTRNLNPAYAIFSLVILAPWAFVGFEVTAFDTAHFRFPLKKARGVLILSILLGGFVYFSMSLVSVSALPDGFSSWQDYISALEQIGGVASVPTFNAARQIMGPAGLVIVTITAFAAILTGIIGAYRATVRVLSTMAEDHILSERFSKTSYSILFIMLLSILIALLGRNTLSWFVDITSFGAIVAYGYTAAAAYKLAKGENNKTIKGLSLIGTIISIAFAAVQLIPRLAAVEAMGSEAFLLLSLWCLLGFVFYWRTVKRSSLAQYSGMSISGVVLFALLVYSALLWMAKRLASLETIPEVRGFLVSGGIILILIIFIGLAVMLYLQNMVRRKNEASEREKIRAVESSLAKSQFLFNMSHDIRTPMNAIIGYTNLALKEPATLEIHEYLEKINLSSQHLLSLINDILEMSRIENGKVELEYAPADLTVIFEDIHALFSEQMKQKQIDFQIHTSNIHNRYVWCDQKNLNRVLLNIVSNAFKFTPTSGSISAAIWEIGNGEDGYGSYEIRVRDSGIGMSKEFVSKMFNAFERERTSTNSGVEGTGLGLAITKSIVDLMGGNIEVLTSPGSGTEFIIRVKFKLANEDEVPKAETPKMVQAQVLAPDFTKMRLLLVEDNMINMEIAKMLLSQMGFTVETAENGQVAVDMVSVSGHGYYDAILMDIQMPVMDGYTATRTIRTLDDKVLANIPIIAMTANAFQEDIQSAAAAGMQGHIAKPIDIKNMTQTLVDVLSSSRKS